MPAGFKFAGEVYWGSNGAVEAFVEALAECASEQLGPADPLAREFREQRESFSTGWIVFLDEMLRDKVVRVCFLAILSVAIQRLRGEFTESGREWIDTTMRDLVERIAAAPFCPT